ncbi:MFS transporter [Enterococcus sp. RIT-PI-f]|uniref:MFS transporter n=1 Tax=Enterococcus sp. RIT-PI-f TaxID=1690244 RepID=UPI0006B923D7|nr:MFS transporter [Enterococcus sp. RIT-PI-f]KPG68771.1 multidrug MFS transporter [Enterococcus sp. RIT-PI-f]
MENNKKLVGAILATGLMSFAGVLIETAMNVTFPTLIQQFGITTSDVQWVTTIYLLVISIIVPISTFLLKRFQLRTLFLAANMFFLAGLVIDFLSPTFAILLLGRLFQGASTGIALPLMFHIILTYSPYEKRGATIGLGNLTTSIAPAIGPTYGGLLTAHWSWNAIFLFLIPVLLISLFLGLSSIPKNTVQRSGHLDSLSVLAIVMLFSGFLLFLNQLGTIASLVPLAIGLIGLGLFWQRAKGPHPLIRLDVLQNQSFRLFLGGFLVCQFLLLGVSFVLPNFVQIVLGKDAFTAGLIMLPGAAIGAILAPIAGRLLDKVGPKKPILLGMVLIVIGWLALALLLRSIFIWGLVAGHVFYMIGIGLSYSNMMTTGLNKLTPELYADGNAIFNTLQQFSGAVATAIVATIINLSQRNAGYLQGTILGSQIAMFVLWAMVLVILFFMVRYFSQPDPKTK